MEPALDTGAMDFAAFYREALPAVRRGLRSIARELSEEIAQDAFVVALEQWDKISGMEAPDAWVWVVARRMAFRRIGRERQRSAREASASRWVNDPLAEPRDLDLEHAIDGLPGPQRSVVILHYLQGLPVSELASILECGESAAKVWLHRARNRMAPTLSGINGSWMGGWSWSREDVVARARDLGAAEHLPVLTVIMPGRQARRMLSFDNSRYLLNASDGEWLDGGRFTMQSGRLVLHPSTVPGTVTLRPSVDGDRLTFRYINHTTAPWHGIADNLAMAMLLEAEAFTWRGRTTPAAL